MVDPIGPRAMPPTQTRALRESRKSGSTPVVTTVPRKTNETFAGGGLGGTAGLELGSKKGLGAGITGRAEIGGDSFGGIYGGLSGEGNMKTPVGGVSGETDGRLYPFDDTDK